jgi:hypothetical protein
MKQIFDWLREQMQKRIDRCEVNDTPDIEEGRRMYILGKQGGLEKALELVNEAEAKWELDCCEWKPTGLCEPPRYLEAHDLIAYELDVSIWKYCPICGKPIKISEVE